MPELQVPCYHVCDFALSGETACANPFLVDVSATFTHESGASVAEVPGFYDGEDRWVVRFSPTQEGVWRGRTVSREASLHGHELALTATPNPNPRVHGRLGCDPAHPRRFAWADGAPLVALGFEFDWLFAVHQSQPDLLAKALDRLAACGFNYLVTNLYAHAGFSAPGPHVYSPPRHYVFGGTNDAPDHAHLNPEFFRDFDRMMADLHSRGFVVHLMLQVQNKHVRWPARRSVEDDLYWRYAVARYQAYGNVIWDLAVHDLAIMDYIFDLKPLGVSATGMSHFHSQPENTAFMTLFYPNSFISHIHVSWLSPVKVRRIIIAGSKEMVIYDDVEPTEKVKVYDASVQFDHHKENPLQPTYRMGDIRVPKLDQKEALLAGAEHFVDCIQTGKKPLTDGEFGRAVVKVLQACDASLKQGGNQVAVEGDLSEELLMTCGWTSK